MKRNAWKCLICKKDYGMALTPWVLLYFFIALYLFFLIFCQNMHVSTKYLVQDGLASAALAGEVADLDVYSQYHEIVITDLDYCKSMFEESLQANFHLTDQGYPSEHSAYFDRTVPIQIQELTLYNISQGKVYRTNLLQENGKLVYEAETGLENDARCVSLGDLPAKTGQYTCYVTMMDGQKKEIKNTSLYARISFGVKGYDKSTVIVEKDILTDIQQNE